MMTVLEAADERVGAESTEGGAKQAGSAGVTALGHNVDYFWSRRDWRTESRWDSQRFTVRTSAGVKNIREARK